MRILLSLVCIGGLLGCSDDEAGTGGAGGDGGDGTGGSGGGGQVTVDDAAISQQAAGYAQLTKVNQAPFMSAQHDGMPMVNVYVNGVGAAEYAKVPMGAASFPEGTLIVKEMLDAQGQPMMLTAMYKAPEGYDPTNRDWWWGMLMPNGTPAQSGSVGKIAMCNGCHQSQTSTDAAFGLPQ